MLELSDLSFRYPGSDKPLWQRMSLVAPAGTRVGVSGPNGSGKTTLLEVIAGALTPTTGTVTLDGRPIDAVKPYVAVVRADFDMFEYLSFEQNIAFFAAFYGRAVSAERTGAMLERYRLDNPGPLAATASRGMRRKLQLVTALLLRPKVLVADESFDGLDEDAQECWRSDLSMYARDGGIVVFTQHDRARLGESADIIITLDAELASPATQLLESGAALAFSRASDRPPLPPVAPHEPR